MLSSIPQSARFVLPNAVIVFISLALSVSFAQEKAIRVREKKDSKDLKLSRTYARSHALCIGVNSYKSTSIPTLRFAEKDAEEFAALLEEKFSFQTVSLLLGSEATKVRIEQEIGKLQDPNLVGKQDAVIIYYSGHGQTVKSARGEEWGYILAHDTNVDFFNTSNPAPYNASAIDMEDLTRQAKKSPALHTLVIADACYSGFAQKKSPQRAIQIDLAMEEFACQVISAGTQGQEAWEGLNGDHGVFTGQILKRLKKMAETIEPISAMEIGAYLAKTVPDIVHNEKNEDQTPITSRIAGEGEFFFIPDGFRIDLVGAALPVATIDALEATSGILRKAIGLYTGAGIEKQVDEARAKRLFMEASAQGNIVAQMWIALFQHEKKCQFALDRKTAQDTARRLSDQLASAGTMEGYESSVNYLIGEAYALGLGVVRDKREAKKFFRAGVDLSDPLSMSRLADLLGYDEKKEKMELRERAAKIGCVNAMISLSISYKNEKTRAGLIKARDWLNQAAEMGSSRARLQLRLLK